ncbi:MAG: PLP-dependent aminotransferase family protein [Ruminiclostridium sp.]|nr:PLP-dependent aminotransferase family protein [Ruminiclostridium sp.]
MNAFSYRISGVAPSAIREILKSTADPSMISFAAGNPAPEAFPVDTIRKISNDILTEEPIAALQYSITEGYPKLRDWLKKDMGSKGNFNDMEDELVITSGAQQAIETCAKIFCNEGDAVICENPSFIGSLNAFRSYASRLVGVEMDNDGMIPEKLEEALKANPRTAFIYTIPNFQNPMGVTMSLERRKQLLELAYKYNVLVVEDNPYGDLRFAGVDVPSIKSLDTKGHVIYAGSFSKVLSPGLRVGYMIAEKPVISKATVALQTSTVHPNIWAQMVAYRFVTETDFEEHLDDLRQIYKKKCDLMLNSLKFSMPMSISFTEPEGGLFLWGTLPCGDMDSFVKAALAENVAVVPGTAFLTDPREKTLGFRLNYSTPTDEQIEQGVEILAKVAKTMY